MVCTINLQREPAGGRIWLSAAVACVSSGYLSACVFSSGSFSLKLLENRGAQGKQPSALCVCVLCFCLCCVCMFVLCLYVCAPVLQDVTHPQVSCSDFFFPSFFPDEEKNK